VLDKISLNSVCASLVSGLYMECFVWRCCCTGFLFRQVCRSHSTESENSKVKLWSM